MQVFNSFQEMGLATGALQPQSSMSVFNASPEVEQAAAVLARQFGFGKDDPQYPQLVEYLEQILFGAQSETSGGFGEGEPLDRELRMPDYMRPHLAK